MKATPPIEALFTVYFACAAVAAAALDAPVSSPLGAALVCGTLAVSRARNFFRGSAPWRAVQDWLPLPLVVLAYRQMDLPASQAAQRQFGERVLWLDDIVLSRVGLGEAVRAGGPAVAGAFELVYAMTYLVPVAAVAMLYLSGRRDRVPRFHYTFLAGTLAAYALLPLFPSESPRLLFPTHWPPPDTSLRLVNIWVLDHADIHRSVCPSGHVAAACSAALGMQVALPERTRYAAVLGTMAAVIAAATVVGRYHFVVDVVAGIAVSAVAWRVTSAVLRLGEMRTG